MYRVVRLTSPNLNYFIIAGCYIMYATTFIRLIRSTDFTANYVRCNVSPHTNRTMSQSCCMGPYYYTVAVASEYYCLLSGIWNNFSQNGADLSHFQ